MPAHLVDYVVSDQKGLEAYLVVAMVLGLLGLPPLLICSISLLSKLTTQESQGKTESIKIYLDYSFVNNQKSLTLIGEVITCSYFCTLKESSADCMF